MKGPAPGGPGAGAGAGSGEWIGLALLAAGFLVIAAPWVLLPRPLNAVVALGVGIVVATVLVMALFPEVADVMQDLNQGGRR